VHGNLVTLIKGGGAEFRILGSSPDEFPKLPELEDSFIENTFEIFSGQLRAMIRQTIFAVSLDESKPAMTGELFEIKDGQLKIAAIDGFRIAVRTLTIDNKELNLSAIIPGKSLTELTKILDSGDKSIVSVHFTDKHVLFETDEAKVLTRLINGKLMDFENIFETTVGTTFVTVNVKEMADTIERAALISRETRKSPVRLIAEKEQEKLVVESNTETGTFYEELSSEAGIEIDGLHLKIAFNPKYLTDVLRVLDEEKAVLQFTTPLSPCIIKGINEEKSGENLRYLVLPLRDMK
jgi:DNA polymerase-3 subunit beta